VRAEEGHYYYLAEEGYACEEESGNSLASAISKVDS
jgi:hypothetical protein